MRMTRKRGTDVAVTWAVLALIIGSLGVACGGQAGPATPSQTPTQQSKITGLLSTATLTATPTQAATEVPPTVTQTPTAAPRPTYTPRPKVTLIVTPTCTATLTATWTVTPTLATPTPTRPAPTPTPRPQWIAFETERGANGDYEIAVMAPDGTRQTVVVNSWADDVAPAWAPGGRQIAFLTFRDTEKGKWGKGDGSIYVVGFDPATGQKTEPAHRVTDDGGNDDWPAWSPDGKRIVFQSDRSGNEDIWIINADATGLVQLTHNPKADRHPNWSPDGKKIAFSSNRSGNEEVWVIDVAAALASSDDSMAVNLTQSPGRDRYPFWSPDGKQLTFNTHRDDDYEIYVMNADGSQQRNLSQSPQSTEGLADWSPDGKRVVFYSNRTGNKEVYIMDLATLAWTNISNHPANDEFCTWAR